MVFLLRPPALRSIPYARQRTSSFRSVSRVSIYHPKLPQRRPTRGRHPPQNHESRAIKPKTFLPFIPARTRRLPHRRGGATSRASRRRGVSLPPRRASLHSHESPGSTTAPRASVTNPSSRDRSSIPIASPAFVSFRFVTHHPVCVSSRDAERRMGRGQSPLSLCALDVENFDSKYRSTSVKYERFRCFQIKFAFEFVVCRPQLPARRDGRTDGDDGDDGKTGRRWSALSDRRRTDG